MPATRLILPTIGLMLAFFAYPALAQTPVAAPQLRGISAERASQLTTKVKDAQAALRRGQSIYFELLSGAPASYRQTKVTPWDTFLAASFDQPFQVEQLPPANANWKPYRIILLPNGPGTIVLEVEVVLDSRDDIARVQMLSRPPAPF